MDRSFEFAIVEAKPDQQRGERVNVGLIVLKPDGIDVRLPELRKLRTLTGHTWDAIAQAYQARLEDARGRGLLRLDNPLVASELSEVFTFGTRGILRVGAHDYEERVASILKFLVDRPVLSRRQKQERINTEISRVLKKAGVLSERGETIEDHKVVSRFVVSAEKAVVADFAYKATSALKVVSTLDLRGANSAHAKACEKGATLYFAKEQFGSNTMPFGIYAIAPAAAAEHRGEIEILGSFAEGNTFNWLDAADRRRFQHSFY
jgi:hypothetical protein